MRFLFFLKGGGIGFRYLISFVKNTRNTMSRYNGIWDTVLETVNLESVQKRRETCLAFAKN